MMEQCDVLIVGAGPAGLAAAKGALENGAERVLILERDRRPGGILPQCIHDGFGLIRYGSQLTGPEYAARAAEEASGAELETGSQVVRITADRIVTAVSRGGMRRIRAGAVILATGCRERTRGMISVPGSRPAGIFTAGVAQNLVNVRNIMPGREIVILGSGDIGLIMARRLTLEGAAVKAVVEILPQPAGLARNVSQCLYDFNIPLYVSHTVSNIYGAKRLTGVEISEVDGEMRAIPGTGRRIECDTLILSVGLIPENEVALTAGVTLDQKSNGVVTDAFLQTSVPGIFSCGNSRRVMDLADFASEQGELAGRNAAAFLSGGEMRPWDPSRGSSMAKGFPERDSVTCTLCPNGCQVRWDGKGYSGNRCPRGAAFAEQEREQPRRTLTTTVSVSGGEQPLVSARTTGPVPREKLSGVMKELRTLRAAAPIGLNDVLATLPDGVAIVSTERVRRKEPTDSG